MGILSKNVKNWIIEATLRFKIESRGPNLCKSSKFEWAFPEKNFTPTVEDIDFSKYRTPWISYFISKDPLDIHS